MHSKMAWGTHLHVLGHHACIGATMVSGNHDTKTAADQCISIDILVTMETTVYSQILLFPDS